VPETKKNNFMGTAEAQEPQPKEEPTVAEAGDSKKDFTFKMPTKLLS